MNRVEWKWRGKEVEEVKEFKYLGYRLTRNGSQEAQIKERVEKAAMVMKAVWGIGMKLFGKDCERRMWLFDRLVWTVLSYGVQVWEWKERALVERIQERYLNGECQDI